MVLRSIDSFKSDDSFRKKVRNDFEWRSVNRLQANSINKHCDALFETIFVSEIFSLRLAMLTKHITLLKCVCARAHVHVLLTVLHKVLNDQNVAYLTI